MKRVSPRLTLILLLCFAGAVGVLLRYLRHPEGVAIEGATPSPAPLSRGGLVQPTSVPPHPLVALGAPVTIAKRSWSLMTVKPIPDPQFAAFIRTDIGRVFGHLNNYAIDPLPATHAIAGFEFDRRVRFEEGTRYFPAIFMADGFGCGAVGRSESEILVPDEVIDAYRKVWGIRSRNAAAFLDLEEFMRQLNDLATMPASDIRSMFLGVNPSLQDQLASIDVDQLRSAWGHQTYHLQSYLDIQETPGTEFESHGSLLGKIYWIESNRLRKLPPIIFVGSGQWRFLVTPPLT